MKRVDLSDLLAGLPRSGNLTVETARRLAHEILDACEAVEPAEDESEWERVAARQMVEMAAERQEEVEARRANLGGAKAARRREETDQAWRSEVMRMGLELREPSPHHLQVTRGGKVFAEWWPSRGTTMHAHQRGPRCADSSAFVRWLRSLQ